MSLPPQKSAVLIEAAISIRVLSEIQLFLRAGGNCWWNSIINEYRNKLF